jgi:hypothetical protein
MRYPNRPQLVVATIVLCSAYLFAQQQTQPQTGVDDNAGFDSIFDGKTLNGWEGDTKYWRVENGALVGEITPGNEIRQNTFIIFKGGSPANFELKCEYRITDQGNSGINYRSSLDPDQKFVMKGYQFDIDGEKRNAGATFTRHTANNYEEKGRTFMALRGQMTRATDGGKRQVIGTLGDYKEMTKFIREGGEWNTVHIIARGNTLIHMLNGQVMSILIDDDTKGRTMDGQIGVQVHVGGPMKVEYRNIRLKKLD